jgi:hypothetical protein
VIADKPKILKRTGSMCPGRTLNRIGTSGQSTFSDFEVSTRTPLLFSSLRLVMMPNMTAEAILRIEHDQVHRYCAHLAILSIDKSIILAPAAKFWRNDSWHTSDPPGI